MLKRSFSYWFFLALAAGLLAPHAWSAEKDKADEAQTPPAADSQATLEKNREIDYQLMSRLVEVLGQVEQHYVQDISREELLNAAIEGILKKLDPHSTYVPPGDVTKFEESIHSRIQGGVGILVNVTDGKLQVISPIVGGPAYRAGVIAGDRIVKIAGEDTAGWNVERAANKLKGRPGSKVTFTVVHPGTTKEVDVTVTRRVVRVETVMGDQRKKDDSWDFMFDHEQRIGFIRVTAFSQDTAAEVRKAMEELKAQGVQGLVLDLRFNPGGLLSAAVDISDLFIPEGVIVSTEDRNKKKITREAKKPGTVEGFSIAVLVNRYSASASEIVSAALQDHGRAVVVGERTYGKGSVQNIIRLAGGGQLKLTTAGYYRPSGKNIHKRDGDTEDDEWGVTPDKNYRLRLSNSEMLRLIQFRRNRDIVRPHDEDEPEDEPQDAPEAEPSGEEKDPNEEVGDKSFVDRQLQLALKYLTERLAKK